MDFESNNTQQPSGTPFPINTAVGETVPLNTNTNPFSQPLLGFTQGGPWNPAQYAQFTQPMFQPPWMYQQHSGMMARPTSNMDVDRTDSSDSGNWVAHPEYRIVSHIHREIRGCPDLLGHAVIAQQANDPGFNNAVKIVEDDITRPFKESAQRAKAKVTLLEAKLQATITDHEEKVNLLTSTYTEKLNTLQEKYNTVLEEKSKLIVDMTSLRESLERNRREYNSARSRIAPYRRPEDRALTRRSIFVAGPTVSQPTPPFMMTNSSLSSLYPDWGNLRIPFPNQAATWSTLEHSGYRPGRDNSLVTINWDEFDGVGKTSAYVDQCIASNVLPAPTVFPSGISTGLQSIPTTRAELTALVSRCAIEGNVEDIYHLRFAYTLADYLDQGTEYAPNVNPFYDAEKEILGLMAALYPPWSTSSKFLDHSTFRIHGVPTNWSTPCVLPPVNTPDAANRNNWVQWGQYYFVHGDAHSLVGQFMLDCGVFDAENVRAGRILTELTPPRTGKSREAFDAFRLGFISFITKAGLYEELLTKYGLSVSPSIRLSRPVGGPPYDLEFMARHFASCGISISTYNSTLRFGWQFSIDQQHLTTNSAAIKSQYLTVLNEARFRALFYPISPPGPNAIQRLPEDWPATPGIIEFRRRRAQLALLRESKVISSNYKLTRTIQFPDGFDDIGFGALSVGAGEAEGTSSQSDETGTSNAPQHDEVMGNVTSLGD
ncbi:hypothetical protein PQX77_006275 [Marasmius sp. AFHP31]|nr:hypothetical protein PQX77_006275 [Marasmius sp. AFHP31]